MLCLTLVQGGKRLVSNPGPKGTPKAAGRMCAPTSPVKAARGHGVPGSPNASSPSSPPRRAGSLDLRGQQRCVPGPEGPPQASLERRKAAARQVAQAPHVSSRVGKGNEKGGASGEIGPVICGQTQSAPGESLMRFAGCSYAKNRMLVHF